MYFRKLLTVLAFFVFLFTSCGTNLEKTEQNLDDSVYWALGSAEQTVADAKNLSYEPLELGYKNILNHAGEGLHYVWVRIDFDIKEKLNNKTLGLVIPYIHFAEKVWLNNSYIGEQGRFYPKPKTPLYQGHFYSLPEDLLIQNGENHLYLLVMSEGFATISSGITIDEYQKSEHKVSIINFNCSKIYMYFAGVLLCAFIFFLIFYFARKQKHLLSFSAICLTSFIFLNYYILPEMPWYHLVDYFWFTKIFLCCFFYLVVYSVVAFILAFVEVEQPKAFIIFKRIVVLITIVLTLAAPNYSALMKLCVPMIITYLIHFIFGMQFVFKGMKNPQLRKKCLVAIHGFLPMVSSLVLDLFIRHILKNLNYPYFVLFGLVLTIGYFIVYFSIDYGRVYVQNQTLTDDLRREVELQTVDLTFAKESLEQEVKIAARDLQMASIVQQKFFPKPVQKFLGWDFEVAYDPLVQISGDMYDFYSTDQISLDGLSLFDASGHGVAAALVTMLSKNIVYQSFHRSLLNFFPVSYALKEINEAIIAAKGDIENYLTGVMVRFTNNEQLGGCKVELASAGHPYPVVYSSELGECIDLKTLENGPHYGAIGMEGIEVAYCDIEFVMKKNDIMICFSDGIIETSDENRNEFGRERLENIVKENSKESSSRLLEIIKEKVQAFRGENPRDDDITIIILKKE